jgi:hypothetical protein
MGTSELRDVHYAGYVALMGSPELQNAFLCMD